MTLFQTLALGTAGIVATAIGAALTMAPAAFLAGSGIVVGPDPALLSELRAPGAGLAVLGLVMLSGLRDAAMRPTALVAAAIVYVGYPLGRLVGIAIDGLPPAEILAALTAEIAIALWLALAFLPRRTRRVA
ncbi:DUF4345 domain-containing protein [uncultured Jannaschia sp.]|uniref:DUF4345 domain-containing protein n=1 Tax=uncultured Jannaschia sp. TaxID=293347 RepID=UPI00261CAB16|nr:DUF4345 domain-containing protein [uncultured Jannaschia sp.]